MIRAGSDKRGAVSAGIGGMAVLIAFLDEDVGNSVSDCSRSDEHLPAKSDGNAATLQAAAPGAGFLYLLPGECPACESGGQQLTIA